MGSQNVTNFETSRKLTIQRAIREYEPGSDDAWEAARRAAIEVIGSLKPTTNFVQALTSPGVDAAAREVTSLAEDLKSTRSRQRENEILERLGVDPAERQPYTALAAALRRKVEEELNVRSRKTSGAEAARDALGRTLLDLIQRKFPGRAEAAEATREEVLGALRAAPLSRIGQTFVEHTIEALLDQAYDAVRGSQSRAKIQALSQDSHESIAKQLSKELTKDREGHKYDPAQTTDHIQATLPFIPVFKPAKNGNDKKKGDGKGAKKKGKPKGGGDGAKKPTN